MKKKQQKKNSEFFLHSHVFQMEKKKVMRKIMLAKHSFPSAVKSETRERKQFTSNLNL